MTLSQYLGRGVVSRGRMTISPGLATVVSTAPYLHNDGDLEAVIQGIKNVQNALNIIPNLTWVLPPPNGTVEDYVNGVSLPSFLFPSVLLCLPFCFEQRTTNTLINVRQLLVTPSARRSNHWMGTAKIGTDDGRQANGSAVVDLNTRVYGTDNLFVVDASIFPGMPTGNPSAMIVIAAEQAATKILALRS
jgi:cellobiose dehydrogenase (acceptor)